MDNNDYDNTSVPNEILKTRNKFISERGEQLHEFYLKHSDETIKYLLYVNAGGAAISIGFMGASESIRSLICLRIALLFFAIGLICVGILRAILLNKIKYLFDNWQKDVKKYWKSQIEYTELIENDDKRSGSARRAFIVGYISLVSFIIGLILGGVSLFFNY